VEDVLNGVLAVKKAGLPYMDTERIGMLGHSMGGGIAQGIAVIDPDLVDAIVLYAPVSGDAWENYERYTSKREEEADMILTRYGSKEAAPEFWKNASSATYYANIAVPVMIHIGSKDDSTPIEWSRAIDQNLRALGKDVTLYVYENERHEFGSQWTTMMQRSAEFFRTNLK
jgi:dipeptidyl aminopeptidase/acylaminoacyl peptidase